MSQILLPSLSEYSMGAAGERNEPLASTRAAARAPDVRWAWVEDRLKYCRRVRYKLDLFFLFFLDNIIYFKSVLRWEPLQLQFVSLSSSGFPLGPAYYDISTSIFPKAPFIKEELKETETTHLHATSRTQRTQ